MDRETLRQYAPAITRAVNDLVRDMAGSISAEHGIGIDKIDELEHYRSKVELDTMRVAQARARSEEHHEPREDSAAVMTVIPSEREGRRSRGTCSCRRTDQNRSLRHPSLPSLRSG